jgi:hypothetical protein
MVLFICFSLRIRLSAPNPAGLPLCLRLQYGISTTHRFMQREVMYRHSRFSSFFSRSIAAINLTLLETFLQVAATFHLRMKVSCSIAAINLTLLETFLQVAATFQLRMKVSCSIAAINLTLLEAFLQTFYMICLRINSP